MIHEYIQAALELAHYGMIEDEEPYYGEIARQSSADHPQPSS